MNPFRRPPPAADPDPAAREHALARLAGASTPPGRLTDWPTPRPPTAPAPSAAPATDASYAARNDRDARDNSNSDNSRNPDSRGDRGSGLGDLRDGLDELHDVDDLEGGPMTGGWVPEATRRDEEESVYAGLPDRLRGARWTLSVKHVIVIALVLVAGIGWAGWSLLRARPVALDQPPGIMPGTPVGGTPVAGGGTPGPSTPTTVVVHVAGKVRHPGLVRTRAGARVADVIAAAGGALPGVDLSTVNLARPVTDGEQILVGITGPGVVPGSPAIPGSDPAGGQVDLNTATAQQLEALPGVGPVLAQRIVDWRTEHGRFTSVDELQEVSGVGDKKFASLKPHVRV